MNAVVQQEIPGLPSINVTPMQLVERAMMAGNLELVEKFMALQERWEARQARKAFDAAIALAKAEIKPILKKQEVDFPAKNGGSRTNYKYEGFSDIAEHVDPILAKHGLSYRHRPKQEGKILTITCILSHRDGCSEETSLFAGNDESGNKNSIQSIGSTATYLQRYTLKLALGLAAAKDDDGKGADDAEEEPTLTEDEIANLEALITEVAADKAKFLAYLKVESLGVIWRKKYKDVVRLLEDKRK
jgi:hypothetical protein